MQFIVRLEGTTNLGLRFDDGTEIPASNALQTEIANMSQSEGKPLSYIHTPQELAKAMKAFWKKKARAYNEMARTFPGLLANLAQTTRGAEHNGA